MSGPAARGGGSRPAGADGGPGSTAPSLPGHVAADPNTAPALAVPSSTAPPTRYVRIPPVGKGLAGLVVAVPERDRVPPHGRCHVRLADGIGKHPEAAHPRSWRRTSGRPPRGSGRSGYG